MQLGEGVALDRLPWRDPAGQRVAGGVRNEDEEESGEKEDGE